MLVTSLLMANLKPYAVLSKDGHHSPGWAFRAMASAVAPRGHILILVPFPRVTGGHVCI